MKNIIKALLALLIIMHTQITFADSTYTCPDGTILKTVTYRGICSNRIPGGSLNECVKGTCPIHKCSEGEKSTYLNPCSVKDKPITENPEVKKPSQEEKVLNINTENDCAIDLKTTAIVPDSKITDYGIITNNDILAVYNSLQKICKGNQNQDGPSEKSYIIQMYKSVVKDKFMLANTDYATNPNSPITADPNAKKRYDQKIKYYKDNKGLNPQQLKSDFDDIRKYGIYNNNINPNNCVYKADNTKGLYNKLYNLCDMTKCMRDKIITKSTDANIIEADYQSCKSYIDDVISKELDREQDIITKYATRMTNSNFDTYINKYIGFRMTNMQEVIDKIDGYINFLLKKITKFTKNCMG